MPATPPVVKYVILPVKMNKGQQYTVFVTEDFDEAEREGIKQAAATGQQQYLLTTTHYIDSVVDWPKPTVDSLVIPVPTVP